MRQVAASLHEVLRVVDDQVREHALLFLLEGALAVSAGEENADVSAPALVRFDPTERHEVRATADARLVLCLSPWPGDGWHDSHAGAEHA